MLVVFCGADGAGKSAQIEAIDFALREKNITPTRVWARGGYTPLFLAVKRAARMLACGRLPKAGKHGQRTRILQDKGVSRMWLSIAILDLIAFWGVWVRIKQLYGGLVICDRYIDDTRLDFRRNFPAIEFEKMWLWSLLEHVVPIPNIAFLLWVPVDVSLRRSKQKNEPFPDDEATLSWRLEAYLDNFLFPTARYVRLDGRRSMSELSEEIIDRVFGLINIAA